MRSGSISAGLNAPSSSLWCFEIEMLKRRKGNPFPGHFLKRLSRWTFHLETDFEGYWHFPGKLISEEIHSVRAGTSGLESPKHQMTDRTNFIHTCHCGHPLYTELMFPSDHIPQTKKSNTVCTIRSLCLPLPSFHCMLSKMDFFLL